MEMKDNEIINVIEAMLENYYGSKCQLVETLRLSFDLINRQQAEIEKWKKAATKEFTCFVGDPHRVESCPYLDELEKANAEIEQLRQLVIESGREQDRLMAEIERLKLEAVQSQKAEISRLELKLLSSEGLRNKQEKEIEELRKGFTADMEYFASEYDSKIKSEAIKELAERVNECKEINPDSIDGELIIYAQDFDNLVKEMTEGGQCVID